MPEPHKHCNTPKPSASNSSNRALLYKLAILKASGWILTCVVCLIYFVLINTNATTPVAGLIASLIFGGMCVLCGLLMPRIITTLTPAVRFAYLLTDVLFLSAVIHFTGGIINPFTSSLLVPIALAVTLLPRIYTLILISIACGIYGYWLMTVDQAHMAHHNFSLHLYGMGINFLLSAMLLTIFISHALELVKKHEKMLIATREKIIKDEQLVGIASLTANTAHALGTPLQTLTIITDDLTAGTPLDDQTLAIIKQQLKSSQSYLQQLVHTAKIADSNAHPSMSIDEVLIKIKNHYDLQPHSKKLICPYAHHFIQTIDYNESLFFAIINLIDNALRAASHIVTLEIKIINNSTLSLLISDDGIGIPKHIVHEIGTPFIHSRSNPNNSGRQGLGLGYYLSNYTIEQNNGKLLMTNAIGGGARTEIQLPIKNIV
ncbi:ATP-binding protein [Marinagarivorans algicola]|uniref:ATP-binding protein n=1 Tax=Marinagarivorans algicola TaxID=1513270 RepID=UPI0006B9EFB7|nr:ATP-binding protein [Marinagarivorans algicola]